MKKNSKVNTKGPKAGAAPRAVPEHGLFGKMIISHPFIIKKHQANSKHSGGKANGKG